jgi:PTS system N-acetylglucosamine-specific IIC component
MYHTAKDKNKKAVYGLLLAAAISSFFKNTY